MILGSAKLAKASQQAVIETKTKETTLLSEDGTTVLLTCKYEYPQIIEASTSKYIDKINRDIERIVMKLYQDNCLQGVPYAKEFDQQLKSNKEIGSPSWLPFTTDLSYAIQWNKNDLLSFTMISSQWFGGAHPSYEQLSYTYDLRTGKRLSVTDLLNLSEKEIKTYIAMAFNKEAAKHPEIYFEDEIKALLDTKFNYRFYLGNDGFVFYFNPYEIAPYAAGVVHVTLSYEDSKNYIKEYERFLGV